METRTHETKLSKSNLKVCRQEQQRNQLNGKDNGKDNETEKNFDRGKKLYNVFFFLNEAIL